MAETTGIAWCDHTWSPWIGCTEVSPGCTNCYARELDRRHRYGGATHWGVRVPRYRTKSWDVPRALDRRAKLAGVRRTIFPSMCDPFDNEVPDEWRIDFGALIRATPNLTWLLLTKRIGNADRFQVLTRTSSGDLLPNVWLGASVVNQEEADRDVQKLLATPAVRRFVSYEPALGPIRWKDESELEIVDWLRGTATAKDAGGTVLPINRLDWLIAGGESAQGGAKARPFVIGWARETMRRCRAAGVPFFMKQFGSNATNREGVRHPFKDRAGSDPAEWPEDLRVQEFPA